MKRFQNILFVASPSEPSNSTFQTAVDLAQINQAKLTVLIAIEELPRYVTRLTPLMLRKARLQELENTLQGLKLAADDVVQIETKVVEGKPFVEIVKEVLRHKRDLVIKSVEPDTGVRSFLFGATDMHLLRKCPCPVWLLKEHADSSVRKILAAVDFNDLELDSDSVTEPLNRKILELAYSLSKRHKADLHIVHAWNVVGEDLMRSSEVQATKEEIEAYLGETRAVHQDWLDQLLQKAQGWMRAEGFDSSDARVHLPKGKASLEIPRVAEDVKAELIVMGTIARTGISGAIMGNTAETILHSIDCSVLAVKPDTFRTPIEID